MTSTQSTSPLSTSVHVQLQSIAISVEDLDRAIDWWHRIFGFQVVTRTHLEALGADVAIIQGLDFRLELIQVPHAQRFDALFAAPPAHLLAIGAKALVLETSDLSALTRTLEEYGVTFLWQELALEIGVATAIRDSEGNLINIFQKTASSRSNGLTCGTDAGDPE